MSESKKKSSEQTPMRRILGNFGYLLRGRGIAAVMMLAGTTLMARSLGPSEFGMVVLIQTYVLLVRGLLNFQLFEAIVRYGVPLHDAGDKYALKRLIGISWQVDYRASLVATMLAALMAYFIGPLMDMDDSHIVLLALYSFTLLPGMGNATAVGVLRLFDRFDIIGKQMMVGPIIRFIGVVLVWWFDGSVSAFVAILAFSSVAENLYLNWCGWSEYQQHAVYDSENKKISKGAMAEFSGLRHFIWVTYWQANIDLIYKSLSIMLAGYFLGAAEAGLLRLARQFSSMLSKPSVLIRQVVFLDLTRSWNQGDDNFKLIAYRTAFYGFGLGMLFVMSGYFFGADFLSVIMGGDFVAAAPILTLLLLAASLDLTTASLRAAAYATGHAGKVLSINVITTVIYLIVFIWFVPLMGLVGAGIAACVGAVIPMLAMIVMLNKITRK